MHFRLVRETENFHFVVFLNEEKEVIKEVIKDRRDRGGRRGGGVVLYIKEGIVCEELSVKNGRE